VEYNLFFTISAIVIGFFMAWGVGANDLANVMSTTMGSRALTVRQAMIIAIIFEFAGALLGGIHVTHTIRTGIINTLLFVDHPHTLVLGMLATLLASMVWMIFASFVGMPVSITNTIIGAIVGFGVVVLGVHAIHWHTVFYIGLSWIISPCIAGIVGFLLFYLIKKLILATNEPCKNARRYLPFFFFLVGIVMAVMIVLKDLSSYGIHLSKETSFLVTFFVALIITLVGRHLCNRVPIKSKCALKHQFDYVEKLFSFLMAFTACTMVFAHGSNDVAIAMGPVAAIFSIIKNHGIVLTKNGGSVWILVLGCSAVILGLFMYGRKVIATVGRGITELTPSRAFAATIAAATTVIVSTSAGIPVSATQTLVGGVFGVGIARGIGALNLNIIRNILLSWLVTVPAAAGLAILFFDVLKALFLS